MEARLEHRLQRETVVQQEQAESVHRTALTQRPGLAEDLRELLQVANEGHLHQHGGEAERGELDEVHLGGDQLSVAVVEQRRHGSGEDCL